VKTLFIILAALAVLILLVVAVGALLPAKHVSSREVRFKRAPAEIWGVITDYQKFPEWRNQVKRIEALPAVNGSAAWREIDSHGDGIPYVAVDSVAPQRLVTKIADPKLPFGGTWTFEITPANDGTSTLRITENGEIYNPLFRFVSRFFLGYSATQTRYLRDLGAKLGEPAVIEK
jgi:polyketide cyclase/dehydrase/lipid transport protein